MARRYYLCGVIGAGTPTDRHRPSVAQYVSNYVAVFSAALNQALVMVNVNNHAVLRDKPDVYQMPDWSLDGKVSGIQQAAKLAMRAELEARGYDPALADNSDGYRDLIRGVGRRLEPAFHEDSFDVSD